MGNNSILVENHASISPIYGKGTETLYGHVKVDKFMSNESTNPVQNCTITKYIDSTLQGLTTITTYLKPNNTIKNINMVNGKIQVETQDIKLSPSDVEGLNEFISISKENFDKLLTTINHLDREVKELKQQIEHEKSNRSDGDSIIAVTLTNYIDGKFANLKSNLISK